MEAEVFCEDCGSHPAVYCAAEVDPSCEYEEPVDLVYDTDPRIENNPRLAH